MTNLELMTILGNVRSEYILEAQKLRSGEEKKAIRKLSRKKLILIAAVISLLLLLVGCAAVLIALQRIDLGQTTFPQYAHEGLTANLVSTSGYVDSVNYQATQEWIDFLTTYDADRSLEQNRDHNGYILPDDYRVVDFRYGENEQVMCMVLRYSGGNLYGTEFYHRQLSNIKEDGTFAYSGGGADDGYARLRWENMQWVTEKVGPIGYGDNLKDVIWHPYPIDAQE